jgi:hypothetical protein
MNLDSLDWPFFVAGYLGLIVVAAIARAASTPGGAVRTLCDVFLAVNVIALRIAFAIVKGVFLGLLIGVVWWWLTRDRTLPRTVSYQNSGAPSLKKCDWMHD